MFRLCGTIYGFAKDAPQPGRALVGTPDASESPHRQLASRYHTATDKPWFRLAICGHRHALLVRTAQRWDISIRSGQARCQTPTSSRWRPAQTQEVSMVTLSILQMTQQRSKEVWVTDRPTITQAQDGSVAGTEFRLWPGQFHGHSPSQKPWKINSNSILKARGSLQVALCLLHNL